MIMANGTQHATAQHIPTKLIATVACFTVLIQNVENVSNVNNNIAAVQMSRRSHGIFGSWVIPSWRQR